MVFNKQSILDNMVPELASALAEIPESYWLALEEIRLRVNQPVLLKLKGEKVHLRTNDGSVMVTKDMLERMVLILSKNSVYAFQEELSQGYITIKGGHRVGFAGTAVMQNHRIQTLKDISSLNLRLARDITGAADGVLPYIFTEGKLCHTLLVSGPGIGKTTVLRDLARQLADGLIDKNPKDVGVVDERMELAAVYQGVPQLNVGSRTDVISGCLKAEGMMLLIRSMCPEVLIADEIGRPEDVWAVQEALNAGIQVITTAHGSSYQEVLARPALGDLLKAGFFQRVLILGRHNGQVVPIQVYDQGGERLD